MDEKCIDIKTETKLLQKDIEILNQKLSDNSGSMKDMHAKIDKLSDSVSEVKSDVKSKINGALTHKVNVIVNNKLKVWLSVTAFILTILHIGLKLLKIY